MSWVYLFIAGIFEVVWATALKYTHGLSRPLPILVTAAGSILSFIFLYLALRSLPLGTAYAAWTGIGVIGTVITGIILFHEPLNPVRLFFIALIFAGIIGLNLTSAN